MAVSRTIRRCVVVGALGAIAIGLTAAAADRQGAAGPAFAFRAQEIATNFGVSYAVVAGDVNGDGRQDILSISGTDLVWFEAPSWQMHTIASKVTTPDNVTLAPYDIDGDGRLDIALGAGWTRANTGTLQWVRQNPPGSTPAWEVHPITAERTLHRIRFADIDGDGRQELIVAPLHGADNTGPAWEGVGARLLVLRIPANPRTDPWPIEVADDTLHILHNFWAMNMDADPADELITASREGLNVIERGANGRWTRTLIGEGSPGEVKFGRVGGRRMFAVIEPWHGSSAVVYAEQPGLWAKTTIEPNLAEGHAIAWGDFDGDDNDELVVGWRGAPSPGVALYSIDRNGAVRSKTVVDDGGMGTEDVIVGDFNGDGRPDIVAGGRSTRNIKIYWNETSR